MPAKVSHHVTLRNPADTADVDLDTLLGAVTSALARPVLEGGLTELIGINEQVDQNEYCAEVEVTLAGTYSGEILAISLYSSETGTGAVQTPAGVLYIFDATTGVAAGDTAITATDLEKAIGLVTVATTDWYGDSSGKMAHKTVGIPFHALASLFFVFQRTDAASFNDAAGDDELLKVNFWYRRDS